MDNEALTICVGDEVWRFYPDEKRWECVRGCAVRVTSKPTIWFEKDGVRYTLMVQMESVDDDDHGVHFWPATEEDMEMAALATGGTYWTADEMADKP